MTSSSGPQVGVAFLLAQLGAHASERFAAALESSELSPALAGILRILRTEPQISQQELAARIGIVPSRLVSIIDDLEGRGWLIRTRDRADRRVNRLSLTEAGNHVFADLALVARAHEERMTTGLDDEETQALRAALVKLADLRGLTPGVHPGYRSGE